MSQFFFFFHFTVILFFMILACGGEIIDVESRKALALVQVRHRLSFSFLKKARHTEGKS